MLVQSNQKIISLILLTVALLFFSSCATVKTAKFITSKLVGKTAQTYIGNSVLTKIALSLSYIIMKPSEAQIQSLLDQHLRQSLNDNEWSESGRKIYEKNF